MLWLILSILTAGSSAAIAIFSKISLRSVDEYLMAWIFRVVTTLLLIPIVVFYGVPSPSSEFFTALLIGGTLNALTTVLYMKAIRHADVSLVSPLLTFTPLFLLITSPIIVGEVPTLLGMLGVLLIVAGAYTLNLGEARKGLIAPLKLLLKNKGARYMLAVAFIWSITSNYDKIGALASSTLFWIFSINLYYSILITPFMLRNTSIAGISNVGLLPILLAGVMHTIMSLFQIAAIKLALVAYVISIKRTSAIISVLLAALIFKEKYAGYRLVGSILMVVGVVLISIFGAP